MKTCKEWKEFLVLQAGNGEKIESWKGYTVRRPDPQAIWSQTKPWLKTDGHYHRSNKGGGNWEFKKTVPSDLTVSYKDLTFKIAPTNFKHMGLFPEQAYNWDFMMDKIKTANRPIKVLNLFAYTGGATMACSKAGALEVVHVDASKGMIAWAKENMHLCNLDDKTIRFIVDDCLKFVEREKRRGHTYDAIIMDPPSYGRGSKGEVWKFEENINELVDACVGILSDKPLFFQINSYTTGISATAVLNVLKAKMHTYDGIFQADEIGLPIEKSDFVLPCGIYARWETK